MVHCTFFGAIKMYQGPGFQGILHFSTVKTKECATKKALVFFKQTHHKKVIYGLL